MSKARFIAIDLETTGLDPQRDQILQIGAVAFDDGIVGTFERTITYEHFFGDAYALAMNQQLLYKIARGAGVPHRKAYAELSDFIAEFCATKPYAVGFNVGKFDLAFLHSKYTANGVVHGPKLHHRTVELGSVFMNADGTPGTSNEVIPRLLSHAVAHDALQDAMDAALLYMGRLRGEW